MTNFLIKKIIQNFKKSINKALLKSKISGYENAELSEVVIQKNKNRIKLLEESELISGVEFQALAILNYIYSNKPLKIVDFGGGAANHFYICERFIPQKISSWIVIENHNLVKNCEKHFENPKLFFLSNLDRIKSISDKPDVVFSSSALQYTTDPIKTICALIDLDSEYLVITRTPLTESEEPTAGEQKSWLSSNGPGPLPDNFQNKNVYYPIMIPTKKSIESTISNKYTIILRIEEGITSFQNVGRFNCFTYIAKRKRPPK